MVEFGLKLQDNKVEEWAEKYMDYEKLKRILQNAKKTQKASKELERRNQFIVKEVRLAYETNGCSPTTKATASSMGDITVESEHGNSGGGGGLDEFMSSSRHSELSSLTGKSDDGGGGGYGATMSTGGLRRSNSELSLASAGSAISLLAKMSQASGLFHKHRQEQKLKESWKLEEKRHAEFSKALLQEVSD